MNDYKKLEVWKDAVDLVTDVYFTCENFPDSEKFGLTNQIKRCAVSIPSNIAEGAGRSTKKDFANFLHYAIASSYELETQLLISKNLNFIKDKKLELIEQKLISIQKRLYSLIKSLKF
ncbi:MAG: four helix bundle protein [Chitinophagales bacterium]